MLHKLGFDKENVYEDLRAAVRCAPQFRLEIPSSCLFLKIINLGQSFPSYAGIGLTAPKILMIMLICFSKTWSIYYSESRLQQNSVAYLVTLPHPLS